jgi:cyclopropane fatty-acyl-phospholipid synthase-like methyltransferase
MPDVFANITDPSPQPETITELFEAVYPSFAVLAGMELDLFTQLQDGALNVEQISKAIGVQATKLRPLLYALVVAGLLTVQDDLFSNTPEADHFLVRGKSAYLGGVLELVSYNWTKLLKTAATIRAGGPLQLFDYHSSTAQDELMVLFRGLYPAAVVDADRLMDQHDFSTCRTLLDVGGGSGALAITIVQANPHLKATVVDLPLVTPITRQLVEEANAADRVEILTADVINDTLLGSYDVIVARHVIQTLSIDDSRALLRNLSTVLRPGGVIHLIGWILDNSRLTPQKTVVEGGLVLLDNYADGEAYTEQEYYDWLDTAGFEAFERVVMSDSSSILTAHKAI